MRNTHTLALSCTALFGFTGTPLSAQSINYQMDVEIIQVRNNAGGDPSPLDPMTDANHGYIYENQVNDIWAQAGIQINFIYSTWDNTDAQRLTSAERGQIYDNSFPGVPAVGVDRLQFFFVWDHPGTGYNGTTNSGWKNDTTFNPSTSASNAGNAQLYIDGTFSSNGRGVMANRGFSADSLSGTLAHEIGHSMGLRHVNDVNGGAGAGTTQDPNYMVAAGAPNLMWAGGTGPAYDGGQTLQQNFDLNQEQIDAVIYNASRFDADGNGQFLLQPIPEPSSAMFVFAAAFGSVLVRRRK